MTDTAGVVLLAPESRGRTWDVLVGGYGPDIEFIDRALEWVFDRFALDTRRLAITGFSDGASYALSLGITNGDLFTCVIAFSPGFMVPARRGGKPPRLRLPRDARSSTFRNYTHSEPRFRTLLTEGGAKHLDLEWT